MVVGGSVVPGGTVGVGCSVWLVVQLGKVVQLW